MYLTIKGLVLRVVNYNDSDALLTVLTHSHGKLTLKARGLHRRNSRLVAPCQLLAYSEFTVFAYREYYTINEAKTITLFQDLRKDIQKLSLGTYFAQIAEVLCQEDIPNPELLTLVLNALHGLSVLNLAELKVKAAVELRCACLAGYSPDISGCGQCGDPNVTRFDLRAGRFECAMCRNADSDGIRMPVEPGILDAIRYICTCDPKRIFSFDLPATSMEKLSQISELYLSTQLERGFTTLDFYKSLFIMS